MLVLGDECCSSSIACLLELGVGVTACLERASSLLSGQGMQLFSMFFLAHVVGGRSINLCYTLLFYLKTLQIHNVCTDIEYNLFPIAIYSYCSIEFGKKSSVIFSSAMLIIVQ